MPAVPNWSVPTQFDLTNPYSGTLSFNVQTDRLYLLDQSGCNMTISVRSTTDNVPQANGSILHHRFLTGTQIQLAVWLMEDTENPACDILLADMLDDLSGALRSLLNAGDNAGRLAWEVAGKNDRMLDDCRLLVYPAYTMNANGSLNVTIDSQYPYAQDLGQTTTNIAASGNATLTNTGSAEYDPVFKVYGATTAFTLTNITTGLQFVYDSTLPGAAAIGAGSYAEIDTFRNTIFLNGSGANLKAGVDELNSDYWGLATGANSVTITGASVDVLWADAWA